MLIVSITAAIGWVLVFILLERERRARKESTWDMMVATGVVVRPHWQNDAWLAAGPANNHNSLV